MRQGMAMKLSDQNILHLTPGSRQWTHWREAIFPGLFLKWEDTLGGFACFAMNEKIQPQPFYGGGPFGPTTFGEILSGLGMDTHEGQANPMIYMVHPRRRGLVLSLFLEDLKLLTEDPFPHMGRLVYCPVFGEK